MNNLKIKNFNIICRTCLQEKNELVSIFSQLKQYEDPEIMINFMIFNCLGIEISGNDILPQNICENCIIKLCVAFNFKQQATEIDVMFKNFDWQQLAAAKNESLEDEQNNDKEEKRIEFFEINEIVSQTEETKSVFDREQSTLNTIIEIEQSQIKSNLKDEKKDEIFICQNCPQKFSNKQLLETHSTIHENSEINSENLCKICNKKFRNNNYMQKHLKTQHNVLPKDVILNVEKSEATSLPSLDLLKSNSKTEKLKCPVCMKVFFGENKLDHHLIIKHHCRSDINLFKPYSCDVCDKSYTTFANLTSHISSHTGFRPYECEICERKFTKRSSLISHLSVHTGKKKYLCCECGRSFTSANILHQHKKTHVIVRPHICKVCNKGFHTKNDLRIHLRVHTGEKPFLCSICGRSFSRVTHLNIHLRTHSGLKPYKCKTCDKAFAQTGDLRSHIRIHTGEKPFSCKICNKRFNQNSGLSSHMKAHSGEKGYVCEICNKGFTQGSSLTRHYKSHDMKDK